MGLGENFFEIQYRKGADMGRGGDDNLGMRIPSSLDPGGSEI